MKRYDIVSDIIKLIHLQVQNRTYFDDKYTIEKTIVREQGVVEEFLKDERKSGEEEISKE